MLSPVALFPLFSPGLTPSGLKSSMPDVIRRFILIAGLVMAYGGSSLAQEQVPQEQAPQGQLPDPEQLLLQAEKLYEQLEYEAALKLLIAVQQVPTSTPMHRARSFLYMGVCFTALGNAENAVLSFVELLKIKPNFRLPPGISPSIQAMFKEALLRLKLPEVPPPPKPSSKEGPREAIPVVVLASGPRKVISGQPIDLKIEVTDPRRLVKQLRVHWRRIGGPDFSTIKVATSYGAKITLARIPGATIGDKPGKLQYYVEALDKGGGSLAQSGSLDQPKMVRLEPPPEGSSAWGWWALGIAGGLAVAGGVVAAILLTRSDEGDHPAGTADVSISIH